MNYRGLGGGNICSQDASLTLNKYMTKKENNFCENNENIEKGYRLI